MTSNATKAIKARKHGWRRAESWINGVLNPLILTLPVEVERLERGYVSFRADKRGELFSILPIARYLGTAGRHILTDFQAEHPASRKPFQQHDDLVVALAEAAYDAFDDLRNRRDFALDVRGLYGAAGGGSVETPIDAGLDFVAELVVNNSSPLSEDTSELWQRRSAALRQHGRGGAFDRLTVAIAALGESDGELIKWLERMRLKLCREYDVPAAYLGAPGE